MYSFSFIFSLYVNKRYDDDQYLSNNNNNLTLSLEFLRRHSSIHSFIFFFLKCVCVSASFHFINDNDHDHGCIIKVSFHFGLMKLYFENLALEKGYN